jgi:hypothetical protein
MSRRLSLVVAVATAVCAFVPVGAGAAPPTDTTALREAVTLEWVLEHMAEFQQFADMSEGTREASTFGYQLSADYVAGVMEAADYEVTRQPFEYNYYEELPPAVVAGTPGFPFTDGENISTMDYSGSGTVSGVVQGVNDNIVPCRWDSRTARRTPAARTPTSLAAPATSL